MSTLKKIRENVGLVIVLIAISLFAFIFTDLFNSIGSTSDSSVAEINGTSIDYQDLERKVNFVERNATQDFENPEFQYEIRNQAWQSFVQEQVYRQEWQSSGIGMPDQELKYMLTGRIYHPYVASSGYFVDSLQRYNPAVVDQVLAQADQFNLADPNLPENARRYKQGLIDLLEILKLDRQSNKWQRLIANAAFVSDNEVLVSNNNDQRTANISYVAVPYATISDSLVNVSESEYENYYEQYKERFAQSEETAQIKYTYFPINPSAADSADTRSNLSKVIMDFTGTDQAYQYAFSNSDSRRLDTTLRPISALPEVVYDVLPRTDTVVGPVANNRGFSLYRVVKAEKDSSGANLKLRQILVRIAPGATSEDSTTAKQKARDIRNRVNSTNFAEVAAEESDDAFTKDKGGEMGWVSTDSLGPKFKDAMNNAQPGEIRIAETAAGVHVLEVLERDENLYSVAEILRTISAGTETQDSVYKRASGYQSKVIGGIDFDEALTDYQEARTNTSIDFSASEIRLLGLIGARPVIAWAFQNDAGTVNEEILETSNAYVIARIEKKSDGDYRSLDDVRANLISDVRRLAKARQIASKLKGAAGSGDLNAIVAAYGQGASTGSAQDLRFSSNDVAGIGNEPKVVGRAFGMQVGTTSQPIIGTNGVYIIKLDAVNDPIPLDDQVKAIQKQAIRQSKGQEAVNASYQGLIDIANVRDLRYKFERQ
ncbi:MAG: SurA N-terminal domain-containing protein [Bacteroidota bacterium]